MEIGEIGDVVVFCFGCLVCLCVFCALVAVSLGVSRPIDYVTVTDFPSTSEKLLPSLTQTIRSSAPWPDACVRAFFWNFPSQSLKHQRTCLHVRSVANTSSIT